MTSSFHSDQQRRLEQPLRRDTYRATHRATSARLIEAPPAEAFQRRRSPNLRFAARAARFGEGGDGLFAA